MCRKMKRRKWNERHLKLKSPINDENPIKKIKMKRHIFCNLIETKRSSFFFNKIQIWLFLLSFQPWLLFLFFCFWQSVSISDDEIPRLFLSQITYLLFKKLFKKLCFLNGCWSIDICRYLQILNFVCKINIRLEEQKLKAIG